MAISQKQPSALQPRLLATLIVVAIVVVGALIFFLRSSAPSTTPVAAFVERVDVTVLSDPRFTALLPPRVTVLQPPSVGRANPFAPLPPGQAAPTVATSTSRIVAPPSIPIAPAAFVATSSLF